MASASWRQRVSLTRSSCSARRRSSSDRENERPLHQTRTARLTTIEHVNSSVPVAVSYRPARSPFQPEPAEQDGNDDHDRQQPAGRRPPGVVVHEHFHEAAFGARAEDGDAQGEEGRRGVQGHVRETGQRKRHVEKVRRHPDQGRERGQHDAPPVRRLERPAGTSRGTAGPTPTSMKLNAVAGAIRPGGPGLPSSRASRTSA